MHNYVAYEQNKKLLQTNFWNISVNSNGWNLWIEDMWYIHEPQSQLSKEASNQPKVKGSHLRLPSAGVFSLYI